MADVIASEYRLSTEDALKRFVATVLEKVGIARPDAAVVADVLVAADLRGIESHGVARLESYYVIEGELLVEIEGAQTLAGPGTSAVVKAGQVHRFEVASPTVRFIVATDGTSASGFFRDLSANAPGLPTPENLPQIIEVAKRNGLTSPLF